MSKVSKTSLVILAALIALALVAGIALEIWLFRGHLHEEQFYRRFVTTALIQGTGARIVKVSPFFSEFEGAYVVCSIDKAKQNLFLNRKDPLGCPFKDGSPPDYKILSSEYRGLNGEWPIKKPPYTYGRILTYNEDGNFQIDYVITKNDKGARETELHLFIFKL